MDGGVEPVRASSLEAIVPPKEASASCTHAVLKENHPLYSPTLLPIHVSLFFVAICPDLPQCPFVFTHFNWDLRDQQTLL